MIHMGLEMEWGIHCGLDQFWFSEILEKQLEVQQETSGTL